MRLKGKLKIEQLDVKMYQGIADIASNKLKKIDEELIPTFIIEEALNYFCSLEEYEVCQKIKNYFKNNCKCIIQSSRAEWFGIDLIKQKV